MYDDIRKSGIGNGICNVPISPVFCVKLQSKISTALHKIYERNLWPWRWMQCILPKRWYPHTRQRVTISQKTAFWTSRHETPKFIQRNIILIWCEFSRIEGLQTRRIAVELNIRRMKQQDVRRPFSESHTQTYHHYHRHLSISLMTGLYSLCTLRGSSYNLRINLPNRLIRSMWLTHSWSWGLLEKLAIVQPLKNFPAFYGTRRFITVLTRALHWSLFWARSIQSIPFHPISLKSILILSTHLRLGLPSGLFPSRLSMSFRLPHYLLWGMYSLF
jgi:hypothetical protein